jgi:hypothetical protein
MERIRIPNQATYSPIALSDLMMAAPLVSRFVLGATGPGLVLQGAALGAYAGSVLADWISRLDARPIDFLEEFGADVRHLRPMPDAERQREAQRLVHEVNGGYVPMDVPREELAREVDEQLTRYIASITGQRVETSHRVRDVSLVKLFFPFALGTCDILSGDIAILKETGVFEPHVLAHEFCHRKGYFKELEAQALAYLALMESGQPVLVQAARCERLHRHLRVLAGGDIDRFHELVDQSPLRPELREQFEALRPIPSALERSITEFIKPLYDERMKVTGQNGLSDYDEGFTNFLYTKEVKRGERPATQG